MKKNKKLSSRLKIVDCTLRDGGFDINCMFGKEVIDRVSHNLFASGVDIVEMGALVKKDAYQVDNACSKKRYIAEYDSAVFASPHNGNQLKAIMTFDVDYPLHEIPLKKSATVDFVRVVIRYSEIEKSLRLCEELIKNGYKVSINPAVTMRYADTELLAIISRANNIGVYSMYIVDTYGYMTADDINRLFAMYNDNLDKNIKIGFHGHGSVTLAYANALHFLHLESERELLLDSSIMGMGQGAGNLQTELIAHYLQEEKIKQFDYDKILESCELIERFYGSALWGYSVATLLAANHKTVYKYARYFRNELKLSYIEINNLLSELAEEQRHRFSIESARELLERQKLSGYAIQA